ncbi:MAG: HlyD family efflux transporter periplasmic adaptor subunit [Polyangiaceae bacterium]
MECRSVATLFLRTMRSLAADRVATTIRGSMIAAPFLVAWCIWARFSTEDAYVASKAARVESRDPVLSVELLEAGRITKNSLALGKEVHAGDILVELDSTLESQKLNENLTRIAVLKERIRTLRKEAGLQADVLEYQTKISSALSYVAATRTRAAAHSVDRRKQLLSISDRLEQEQLESKVDHLTARAHVLEQQDALEAARAEAAQYDIAHHLEARRSALQLAQAERVVTEMEGELVLTEALNRSLQALVDRRTVRATANGKLGDVAPLQIGSTVVPGKPLATIIPLGNLHVVAQLNPSDTIGRVKPAQQVRLRFEGFPWTEFGFGRGSVETVASEPRDGTVRVEIAVDPNSVPRIPLQHGLVVTAEVQVDRASPWTLFLRSLGTGSDHPTAAPSATSEPKHP